MTNDQSDPESRRNFWRALLVLGRVSNLPTVWSNCFAGWLLGGGGSWWAFFDLNLGASLLYIGGMYLNDAVDANFDRQHRKERPIPSGHITVGTVWWFAIVLLVAGTVLLVPLGGTPAVFTLLLVASIVLYDVVHKWVAFSPVIMAACRFWLFLLAASIGDDGVTGYAVWCALVLAAYIVGLSYIARRESLASPVAAWPAYLLSMPVVLALLINNGDARLRGIVLSLLLFSWVVHCLRHTFWSGKRNVGRTVSGLLAGIVLVDLLAIGGGSIWMGLGFFSLFALALLFQRYVPAT
ncbi:MAG TPA: hypothetical protein DCY13_03375 [Verrucomicrobiales bacterium]|nr:hypothetical protein [Verrucomicrobiales bacterium]